MRRVFAAALLLAAGRGAMAQDVPDRPISRGEIIVAVTRQFRAIDANHDGIVTPDEFARFRISPAGQAAAASEDPITHVGGHWLDHADPQRTGRVTLQMALVRPLELFDTADVDRDGTVSVGERRMAQAMRALTAH